MNTFKQPSIEQIRTAYRNAGDSPEIQTLLRDLYGDTVAVDNRPVVDRVKTFDDAVAELGNEHPFVTAYNEFDVDDNDIDIIKYLQLRIIVAALNEGWTPQFTENERRWYPWFTLYTNAEIDKMNDDKKSKICRVVGRSNNNANANGGLVYAIAGSASSSAYTNSAARLAFKSEKLAIYAGQQFIEIYRDFIIG
jgi:hypothetical protein